MIFEFGANIHETGTRFSVYSSNAEQMSLCLFNGDDETRYNMNRDGDIWWIDLKNIGEGQRYGFRSHGAFEPENGLWFDASKLLVDPYAVHIDTPFVYDNFLSKYGYDTKDLVPKAIVTKPIENYKKDKPFFQKGGLIYELNVRSFTMLHPNIPAEQRGTIAALKHPDIIAHFKKLGVSAIELMPIVAWIDERHLSALGLKNAWGYNPVALMAIDPILAPNGIMELRETVQELHKNGIGIILDLVFNHTGESDIYGPTISMRGLDNAIYYSKDKSHNLINDTGCGNSLNTKNPIVRNLILDSMRHFVSQCSIDGFRFDLAPILARSPNFDINAPIFSEIANDEILNDRIMIAEPWDIGNNGYQLGGFPENWLEWNDKFRDDVRKFWRGDGKLGDLATRIAGSSDVFNNKPKSINFLAAHDGFTLYDVVSYKNRHNEANGEQNRDGHGENYSWNNGVEGHSDNNEIAAKRIENIKAMLATLFASFGTIMIYAGDEFGRSQHGNNNAYCQDNKDFWINWESRNLEIEEFVAQLSDLRNRHKNIFINLPNNSVWLNKNGILMSTEDWENPKTNGFKLVANIDGTVLTIVVDKKNKKLDANLI